MNSANSKAFFPQFVKRALNLSRFQKQLILVTSDLIILELAIILTFGLKQSDFYSISFFSNTIYLLAPTIAIPILYGFGLYQYIVRYMSVKSLFLIFYALSLYTIVLLIIGYYISEDLPKSILIYHENGEIYKVEKYFSGLFATGTVIWVLSILLLSSSRLIIRNFYWSIKSVFTEEYLERKNIIIYGSGSAGVQLANALNFSKELNPILFIDDDKSLNGKEISGLKVFMFSKAEYLIKKYNIKEVLVAIPSIEENKKKTIIDKLKKFPVKVSTLPGISQLAEGKVKIEDLQPIKIQDILGREQISPIRNLLNQNIKNKNILITGAGGSIGSELCLQIAKLSPKKIILFEQNEFSLYQIERKLKNNFNKLSSVIHPVLGNICDKYKFLEIIKIFEIQTIYHAAAYKHVPMVEKNILEAFQNNVIGTLNCAEAAVEKNIENFVLISTDKAVRPTSFMGATKRLSELIIQALSEENNTKFSAVRFGNVLGSSGSVIPLFESQIKKGGPVTVTDKNITRFFMTTEEAAQLVIQASAIKTKGNIFVLDMGEPIKIIDLAKKMIELSGYTWKLNKKEKGDIEIQFTGLRPGEKLFEELSIGDNIEKTIHPKILSIKEDYMPSKELKKLLKGFKKDYSLKNILKVRKLLLLIIKDYKPEKKIVDILSIN